MAFIKIAAFPPGRNLPAQKSVAHAKEPVKPGVGTMLKQTKIKPKRKLPIHMTAGGHTKQAKSQRGEPQISSEMPGGNPVSEVGDSSQGEQPHGAEVPRECSAEPAAETGPARKAERQARRCVVDLPPAEHHTADRVDPHPMQEADRGGVRNSKVYLMMQRHGYSSRVKKAASIPRHPRRPIPQSESCRSARHRQIRTRPSKDPTPFPGEG